MAAPDRLLADIEDLRSDGHAVALVEEHPRYYVIIEGFRFPEPYEPRTADLMIVADYQYPVSALDMFWTDPCVRLRGAYPQNADQFMSYLGRNWQRWSWHYNWNPVAHNLRSHLEVFYDRLERAA